MKVFDEIFIESQWTIKKQPTDLRFVQLFPCHSPHRTWIGLSLHGIKPNLGALFFRPAVVCFSNSWKDGELHPDYRPPSPHSAACPGYTNFIPAHVLAKITATADTPTPISSCQQVNEWAKNSTITSGVWSACSNCSGYHQCFWCPQNSALLFRNGG